MLTDIDALQRERDDLLEMSQRLQADFENYRKRVLREQTVLVERASDGSWSSCSRCSTASSSRSRTSTERRRRRRKSAQGNRARVRGVVGRARTGRPRAIRALGAPFDPNEHEAVMQDDGDGEPVVGRVLRTGWRLKGRVLRPAMVKVVEVTRWQHNASGSRRTTTPCSAFRRARPTRSFARLQEAREGASPRRQPGQRRSRRSASRK